VKKKIGGFGARKAVSAISAGVLWADSVSLRMKFVVSCDQFRLIRIRQNLLVKYQR